MFSYKPLRRLLFEKELSKTEFMAKVNIAPATLSKISKDEYVSLDVLNRICDYFHCNIEDIIVHIPSDESEVS